MKLTTYDTLCKGDKVIFTLKCLKELLYNSRIEITLPKLSLIFQDKIEKVKISDWKNGKIQHLISIEDVKGNKNLYKFLQKEISFYENKFSDLNDQIDYIVENYNKFIA